MSQPDRRLSSWETFAALLAVAVALILNVAATVQLFSTQGTFGYELIYTDGFAVASVDAGTPAARAGIAAGDHLDFRQSSLHDRIIGLSYREPTPGETVTFRLLRGGTSRELTLRAAQLTASESRGALFSPLGSLLRLAGFLYIAVALIILLRRTNRMTWGLFLYLVSVTDVNIFQVPDRAVPPIALAADLLSVAGTVGLVVFALRFPADAPAGWRALIDRLALPIAALFAIPNLAWDITSLLAGESPTAWMSYGSTLGALALIVLAAATLVATYAAAKREQRQRVQWVIVGILCTLLSQGSAWARYWSAAYPLASSEALLWIGTLLYAAAPFAIAYAVVRQRVFEISFVLGRTLAYTIVSATIFGFFAMVEWLTGRLIEQSGVAIAFVAVAAIGVAFSMDALYGRVDQFVDRTLFRKRHQAERRLSEVAAGLPAAESASAVESALLAEPVRAFTLSDAKLFLRDDDREFRNGRTTLDRSIPLQLQGRQRSLRLTHGDAVLAVPVLVRARLYGIVLYGPHQNGEDIDPDEASSLESIALAAGVAYDHLQAARCEREAARWRKLAERQARELAALRARDAAR
ncbi:MAG TPA: hypothetical protein VGG70_08205 [Candidatus Cybelea sp.]